MRVRVDGIAIEADSVATVVDIVIEAARRRGADPAKPVRGRASKDLEVPPIPTLNAWDSFAALLRRPAHRNALLLLGVLKERTSKGNYLRRHDAATALGLDGSSGDRGIGGVLKGIIRKAKSCGLRDEDVVQHTKLGYRAGRLVISNELPASNGHAHAVAANAG